MGKVAGRAMTVKTKTTTKQKKNNLSLVERCKQRMSSSLLRMIDEDLYNTESKNIPLDKDKFIAYHEAYEKVQEKWPVKPIDYIAQYIKKRIIGSKPVHLIKFADIGCGREALLKKKLPPGCKVASFDIVSTNKQVTQANMDNLPLPEESIGCAVYSLSLMATNLVDILLEGKRILKLNGSMLIVEVSSRFEKREKNFVSKLEKIGLKLKSSKQLDPNGYFTFFHFKKIDSESEYSVTRPNIRLKPCLYKTR